MTKDELVEVVADVLRGPLNDFSYASRLSVARAALAIAMPAAFEIFGEAVKDATCQCEACIDILVRKLGEEWK